MQATPAHAERNDPIAALLIKDSIVEFFNREADLLDHAGYQEWLTLFSEDLAYSVPLQFNTKHGQKVQTTPLDVAWFSDTKDTLRMRVEQIESGVHWADEPVSRAAHLVTNVRVLGSELGPDGAERVKTRCRILVYRNRVEGETDFFVGLRDDTLVREGQDWKVIERVVRLQQSVLQAKNLTLFF